ncbi:glucosaminidase domain-containing protein [Vibrio rumoiensis]|uniref:Glucosaminidase n=1 Tax=Vibrio rumoiensis 1S-45 TaxID=1188252 RepID=A0A1E5E6Q3_9VIBR|nr:glucosaminidase domain-containing protein [Vibrio rumoiensis]OEF30197.1 glucosaminidase [Vibrio rumoiensis 1S-45]
MKKFIMISAILSFWAVYYVQNHMNTSPKEEIAEESESTDVNTKKAQFFDELNIGIKKENERVEAERSQLLEIKTSLSDNDISKKQINMATGLAELYSNEIPEAGIDQAWVEEMLLRVNVLPEALVMIQAANESAWGTSRFAEEGNNFFGQWCYTEGCGLVPLQRVEGATHEVAKFDSPQESINAYFMNVNTNSAYEKLREIRAKLALENKDLKSEETAIALTNGLLSYSERGQAYVNDLQTMIHHNTAYWTEK